MCTRVLLPWTSPRKKKRSHETLRHSGCPFETAVQHCCQVVQRCKTCLPLTSPHNNTNGRRNVGRRTLYLLQLKNIMSDNAHFFASMPNTTRLHQLLQYTTVKVRVLSEYDGGARFIRSSGREGVVPTLDTWTKTIPFACSFHFSVIGPLLSLRYIWELNCRVRLTYFTSMYSEPKKCTEVTWSAAREKRSCNKGRTYCTGYWEGTNRACTRFQFGPLWKRLRDYCKNNGLNR